MAIIRMQLPFCFLAHKDVDALFSFAAYTFTYEYFKINSRRGFDMNVTRKL